MYRKNRCKIKAGRAGGVLLFVKNSLVSIVVDDLNSASMKSIWCKIMVDEKDYLYVGVCYKSPSAEQPKWMSC